MIRGDSAIRVAQALALSLLCVAGCRTKKAEVALARDVVIEGCATRIDQIALLSSLQAQGVELIDSTEDATGRLGLRCAVFEDQPTVQVEFLWPKSIAGKFHRRGHQFAVATDSSAQSVDLGAMLAATWKTAVQITKQDAQGAAASLVAESSPQAADLALSWLIDRRPTRSAELGAAVLRWVADPDPALAGLAVDALSVVGLPQHVAQLLEHVQTRRDFLTPRLYEALASLGGDKAQSFLQFASENEDTPQGRAAAQSALEQLLALSTVPHIPAESSTR